MRCALDGDADRIACLVFVSMRRAVPADVRERLAREGAWDDLVQEGYAIALEIAAVAAANELGERDILRAASRKWYAFLRASGYRRPRGAKTFVKDLFSDGCEQEGLLYSSVLKFLK